MHGEIITNPTVLLQNRREEQQHQNNYQLKMRAAFDEVEKQKTDRRNRPRNRYYLGAKMSEHKFLRLLHGYAHDMPIKHLSPTTHVGCKTIRALYRSFRGNLDHAASLDGNGFGCAGLFLAHKSAPELMRAVQDSRRYKRHKRSHAPRMSCFLQEEDLVTEKLARLLCALDLRGLPLREDQALLDRVMEQLIEAIPRLHPRQPRQSLAERIPGSRPFAHPEQRLFEGFKRYLIRNPLGGSRKE